MMDVATLEERLQGLFPGLLGIKFRDAAPERVRAGLEVQDRLCTMPGILHGGAIMAFADTLGAVGTVLNLKPGESTTTIESKTNFLSAGKGGTTVEGECTLLHRGRRTMVWQTRVTAPDGKLIAVVTQTQAVLEAARQPSETMAAMFAGKSLEEQERAARNPRARRCGDVPEPREGRDRPRGPRRARARGRARGGERAHAGASARRLSVVVRARLPAAALGRAGERVISAVTSSTNAVPPSLPGWCTTAACVSDSTSARDEAAVARSRGRMSARWRSR